MKKLVAVILLSVMVVALCAGCELPTEVSREPVDVRYTEAYEGIETSYEYKYDWWRGDFVYMPIVKTVRHEAKWEIQYLITYDNGEEKTEWCRCTESEYNQVKDRIK